MEANIDDEEYLRYINLMAENPDDFFNPENLERIILDTPLFPEFGQMEQFPQLTEQLEPVKLPPPLWTEETLPPSPSLVVEEEQQQSKPFFFEVEEREQEREPLQLDPPRQRLEVAPIPQVPTPLKRLAPESVPSILRKRGPQKKRAVLGEPRTGIFDRPVLDPTKIIDIYSISKEELTKMVERSRIFDFSWTSDSITKHLFWKTWRKIMGDPAFFDHAIENMPVPIRNITNTLRSKKLFELDLPQHVLDLLFNKPNDFNIRYMFVIRMFDLITRIILRLKSITEKGVQGWKISQNNTYYFQGLSGMTQAFNVRIKKLLHKVKPGSDGFEVLETVIGELSGDFHVLVLTAIIDYKDSYYYEYIRTGFIVWYNHELSYNELTYFVNPIIGAVTNRDITDKFDLVYQRPFILNDSPTLNQFNEIVGFFLKRFWTHFSNNYPMTQFQLDQMVGNVNTFLNHPPLANHLITNTKKNPQGNIVLAFSVCFNIMELYFQYIEIFVHGLEKRKANFAVLIDGKIGKLRQLLGKHVETHVSIRLRQKIPFTGDIVWEGNEFMEGVLKVVKNQNVILGMIYELDSRIFAPHFGKMVGIQYQIQESIKK